MNPEDYFFTLAPGSTEMYLIPNYLKEEYIEWCKCELFDEAWRAWRDFFIKNEIIFKHANNSSV